jgi:23S rRNA (adenine2503-C2)-methyltransferase
MPGTNDSAEDAASLAAFAGSVPSKINLIPYNPVAGFDAPASTERDAARFRAEVARHFAGDIIVRRTRGRDIEAACGMLHRARAQESTR